MTNFVGLDVSQKTTSICVVEDAGRRVWQDQCPLLGARAQRVGMATRRSNHIRGVLKISGLLLGGMRGLSFATPGRDITG
jgi:hypothetical protein